jgi:hypothetical protein
MADFVTKSIDNLSHGLTVKNAMGSLGLKEYVSSVVKAMEPLTSSQQQKRFDTGSRSQVIEPPSNRCHLVRYSTPFI